MLSAERRARRELSQSSAPKSQFSSQEIDSEPDETTYEDTSDDGTFTYNSTAVKKQRIISPKVNAVLDRTNTSVRKASMIAASVLNTAGVPSSTVSLSKSTIHHQRQKQRQKSAQKIRQGFSSTKSVVHWDGKLLPDTDESTQLVDRTAVLLTSSEDSSTKSLGVPKLLSGTGKETADAVKGLLESWDIGTDTVGACFDTTASNTGQYTGACVLRENLLNGLFYDLLVGTTSSKCFYWTCSQRVWAHHLDQTFHYSSTFDLHGRNHTINPKIQVLL